MLILRYRHRLPADYGLSRIRARVAERGPTWDTAPGLGFKAFAVAERGRFGASADAYSSTYLWLDPSAAAGFLSDGRFAAVVAQFGRPRVETLLPLGVATGRLGTPRCLIRRTLALDEDTDLARLRATEADAQRAGIEAGALAMVSALDPTTWRLTRIRIAEQAPNPDETGETILHLAAPGWARLALHLEGADRCR